MQSEHVREWLTVSCAPCWLYPGRARCQDLESGARNGEVRSPGGRRTRVSGGMLSPLLSPVLPTTSLALALGTSHRLVSSPYSRSEPSSPTWTPCLAPGAHHPQGKITQSPHFTNNEDEFVYFCVLWTIIRYPINIYWMNLRIDSGCECTVVCASDAYGARWPQEHAVPLGARRPRTPGTKGAGNKIRVFWKTTHCFFEGGGCQTTLYEDLGKG